MPSLRDLVFSQDSQDSQDQDGEAAPTAPLTQDPVLPRAGIRDSLRNLVEGTQPEQSWSDATVGALEYGAADTAATLEKGINRIIGKDVFHPSSLLGYMAEHPEYAPTQVKNAWDLLTTPKALASRTFGAIPYMAGVALAGAVPVVGPGLAFGMTYTIEAQNAYEQAIESGASEEQANTAARITGVTNGLLQFYLNERLMRFGTGGMKWFSDKIVEDSTKLAAAAGLKSEFAHEVVTQAIGNALQGGLEELTANRVYARPIQGDWKDFLDRRAQEAIGATALTTFMGGARIAMGGMGVGKEASDPTKVLDSLSDRDLFKKIWEEVKMSPDKVGAIMTAYDAVFKRAEELNGWEPGTMYGKFLSSLEDVGNADTLYQTVPAVAAFYSKLRDVTEGYQKETPAPASEVLGFLQNKGVKAEELQWTGMQSWLEHQTANDKLVKKSDLLKFLDQREVKLIETVKGGPQSQEYAGRMKELTDQIDQMRKVIETPLKEPTEENKQAWRNLVEQYNQLNQRRRDLITEQATSSPQYSSYAPPGGSNYTEMLLRVPQSVFTQADIDKNAYDFSKKTEFQSTHWEDPNVVLHLRFDERLGAEDQKVIDNLRRQIDQSGDADVRSALEKKLNAHVESAPKTLFLIELQSDWHQKGRELGYKEETSFPISYFEGLKTEPISRGRYNVVDQNGHLVSGAFETEESAQKEINRLQSMTLNEQRVVVQSMNREQPANAPFKKTWQDVGLKRFLWEAIKRNADEIQIASGEHQNDIYGGMLSEEQQRGQKESYDKIIPQKLQKLAKGFDPKAKMEVTDGPPLQDSRIVLEHLGGENWGLYNVADGTEIATGTKADMEDLQSQRQQVPPKVWSLKLSPELKAGIAGEGFPLFQRGQNEVVPEAQLKEALKARLPRAVLDKDGHLHIMDSQSHLPLIKLVGEDNTVATGLVRLVGDKVYFSGDSDGLAFYLPQNKAPTEKIAHQRTKFSLEDATMYKAPFGQEEPGANVIAVAPKQVSKSQAFRDQLWQPGEDEGDPKGSVSFLQNGKILLRAFANADVSTAMHELAHIARRFALSPEDLKTAEDVLGVKNGVWTENHEEAFAVSFERYLMTNRAPRADLATVFQKMASWLKGIYGKITGRNLPMRVNPELAAVFDRMFAEDTDKIKAARLEIGTLEKVLKQERRNKPPGLEGPTPREEEIKSLLDQAKQKLKDAQETYYLPSSETPAQARWKEYNGFLQDMDKVEPKEYSTIRSIAQTARATFDELAKAAMDVPVGRKFVEMLDLKAVKSRMFTGKFAGELWDLMTRLGSKNSKWLMQTDELGYTNLRKLIDQVGVPQSVDAPNPQVRAFQQFAWKVIDEISSGMKRLQTLRKLPSGDFVESVRSRQYRLPRQPTPELVEALQLGAGPIYEAALKAAIRDNPDMTPPQVREQFRMYKDAIQRNSGMIEYSRFVKKFPDVLTLEGGKKVEAFRTEPYGLLSHIIERGGNRLAHIEVGGQGLLKNFVGNKGKLQELLTIFDQKPKQYGKEELKAQLAKTGVDPAELDKMSKSQLVKAAKAAELPIEPTHADLLGLLENLNAGNLKGGQLTQLRNFARSLRGIDTRLAPTELMAAVKERLTIDVEDHLWQKMRTLFSAQGGNVKIFDELMKVSQGLPLIPYGTGPISKFFRGVSSTLSALQTSSSVAPNVVQTLAQVPGLFGPKTFMEALRNISRDPTEVEANLVGAGAFVRAFNQWKSEPGHWFEQQGRNVAQAVAIGTGIQAIDRFNKMMAGEAARIQAEKWRTNGMSRGDEGLAKRLLLTDQEIQDVKNKQMSDETYAKVIQNGVNRTQYNTENPHRKSRIENIPFFKMIYAYSSYALGATRAAFDAVGDLKDAVRSKDPVKLASASKRVGLMLLGSLGAGYMSMILRGAISGKNPEEQQDQEGAWNTVAQALSEIQLFGVANRVFDAFRYDGSVPEKTLMGMMPQLEAVAGILGAVAGYGRYGKFGLGERTEQALIQNTSLVRGIFNQWEQATWPELVKYKQARAAARTYAINTLGEQPGSANDPINPDYYGVYQMIARGDLEGAQDELKKFWAGPAFANVDPQDPFQKLNGLRGSLLAKAPLAMNEMDMFKFLSTLSPDKRSAYMNEQMKYMALVDALAPSFGGN